MGGGRACHDCLRKASRGSMPAARRPPPRHPLRHGSEGCGVRETRVKWPTLPASEGSGRRSGRGPAFCARSLGAALGGEPAHLPSLGLPVWHMSAKRPASWACRERTKSLAQGRTHGKCQAHMTPACGEGLPARHAGASALWASTAIVTTACIKEPERGNTHNRFLSTRRLTRMALCSEYSLHTPVAGETAEHRPFRTASGQRRH